MELQVQIGAKRPPSVYLNTHTTTTTTTTNNNNNNNNNNNAAFGGMRRFVPRLPRGTSR
jgi:hypothetical protein